MGLYEAINQMMNEYDSKSLQFISLGDIYVHLQNELPQKTSRAILDGFRLAFERLDNKPPLYRLSEGILRKVDVAARVIPSQLSSFEEVGQYIPITLSRVIAAIKNNPLSHQSTKEYGFIRDELNQAMNTNFPEIHSELCDYEAELAKLEAEIEELRAENAVLRASKKEPHPNAEIYAVNKADIFSAIIWVLFRPKHYIQAQQVKRANILGLTAPQLIKIVEAALPNQRQLVKILNEKSPLFWSVNDNEPPLEDPVILKHLSKAINRIPD